MANTAASPLNPYLRKRLSYVKNDVVDIAQRVRGVTVARSSDEGRLLASVAGALEQAAQQLRIVIRD